MRLGHVLAVAVSFLACGGGATKPPSDVAARCVVRRGEAARGARGGRRLWLAGVPESTRAAIAAGPRNGLVVVRVDEDGCDVRVRPVACSAPARHRAVTEDPYAADGVRRSWQAKSTARDFEDLSRADLAGAHELGRHLAVNRTLVVRTQVTGTGELWWNPELVLRPAIGVADLRGPECAAATHYVRALHHGSFRITYDEDELRGRNVAIAESRCQGPTCVELVGVELTPLLQRPCPRTMAPMPGGCAIARTPFPTPYDPRPPPVGIDLGGGVPSGPCRPPVAGQMTEQAAQAKRLYDDPEPRAQQDAIPALDRVMRRETGDDEGNQQLAALYLAVMLNRTGDVGHANWLFERIAAHPCHLGAATARAWLGLGPMFGP